MQDIVYPEYLFYEGTGCCLLDVESQEAAIPKIGVLAVDYCLVPRVLWIVPLTTLFSLTAVSRLVLYGQAVARVTPGDS